MKATCYYCGSSFGGDLRPMASMVPYGDCGDVAHPRMPGGLVWLGSSGPRPSPPMPFDWNGSNGEEISLAPRDDRDEES